MIAEASSEPVLNRHARLYANVLEFAMQLQALQLPLASVTVRCLQDPRRRSSPQASILPGTTVC
jgi:hypothetical protein